MHAPPTPPWTDAAGTMATTARTSARAHTASRAGASKPAPSIVDETIVLATAWSQDDRGVETVMSTLLEANGDILLATEVNNPHADAEASVTYQLLGQLAPSGRIIFASNEYAAGAPVLAVQPDGTYATPEDAANAVNNRYRSPPEAIAALIRNMPGALRRSLFRRGSRDGMSSGTPSRTGSVLGPAPSYEVAIAQSSPAAASADAWIPHPPPSTDWIPHPPTESPPPSMTLSRPDAEPEPLPSELPSRLSRPRSGASSTPGTPAAAALLLARGDAGKRGSTASDVSSIGSPTAKPLDGTFLAALADTVVHQDAGGDGTLGSPLPTPLPPTLARGGGGGGCGTAAGATSPALSTICEDDDDSLAVAAAESNARVAEAPALAMAAVVPAGVDSDAASAAAAAHAMQELDLGPDPQSLLLLHADSDDHDHTDIEDLDDDPTAAHPYRFVDVRNGSVSVPSTAPASPTTLRPNSAGAAAATAPTPTSSSSTAPNSAMPSPPVSPPGTASPAHHHHLHDTDDESDYAWDADADTDLGEPAAPGLPRALPPTFARVPHVSDEYLDHLSNIDGPTSSAPAAAPATTMTSLGSTIVNPPSRHASLRRMNKHQRPSLGRVLPPVPHDDWAAAAPPAHDDVPPVPWPHETLVVGHEDDAQMATLVPASHGDAHLATMVPATRNGHHQQHHDGTGWDHAATHSASAPATTTPPRLNAPTLAVTSTASPQIVYHSLDDFGAAAVATTTTTTTTPGTTSPVPGNTGDTPSSRGKSLLTRLKRAFANVKHAQAMVPPPVPPPLTTIARRRAAAGLDPSAPTTLVRAASAPECSPSSSTRTHAAPRFDTLARLGDPGAAPVAPDTDALQHLESVAAMGTLLPSAAAVAAAVGPMAVVDPVPQPSGGGAHYDELCGHAGHGMPNVPHDVFYGDDGGGGSRRRHEAETQAAAVTGVVYHF
ncbi:hypothetical protein GGF32_002486 [Allomyces javanicus]|nr:hypothetical protein GGF32_002486 [Allomyces javanicus]